MKDTRKTRTAHSFSEDFLERFALEEVIGAGGMAVVYRATQRSLRRPVALKVLDAIGFEETDALARFEEEARVASRLEHPNLVRLIEYGRDRSLAYMVYEYVEGRNLEERIREAPRGARRGMMLDEAVGILADVSRGLAYAHKVEVTHRDLKPANILLDEEGRARIADFGLARIEGEARAVRTQTGIVVGTPECMAPEQARGREVGPPADVYALGIIFYWMLAGRPPFHGDNPTEVMMAQVRAVVPSLEKKRPNLPPGVYELLSHLLQKRPEDRPRAADVERALKVTDGYGAAARSQVQQALRTSPLEVVATGRRRGRRTGPGLALGALLLAGLAVLWWWMLPTPLPEEPEVAFSPTRARFTWKVAPATLEYRVGDDPLGWTAIEGGPVEGRYEVEVGDLAPGERYAWRLVVDEPGLERTFTTPRVARVQGPWPRYGADGEARGWLVRAARSTTLQLRDGQVSEPREDGLLAIPAGVYSVVYPGGLAEVAGHLEAQPDLDTALAGLVKALEGMSVKRVLAAGTTRQGGLEPTPACRRAASDERGRLAGLRTAIPAWLERAGSKERLILLQALGKAEAVDRILRVEGHPPVFDVRDLMVRCWTFSFAPQEREERQEGEPRQSSISLVTAWDRQHIPMRKHMIPPRLEVPGGRGDVEVTVEVANLPVFLYLALSSGERRIPLRPPCNEQFRFRGEVRVRVPAAFVRGVDYLELHAEREDVPRREGHFQVPRLPLFEPDPEKRTHLIREPARLYSQSVVRR